MRKIITICAGLMLCTASYAFSIPITESDSGFNQAFVKPGTFTSVGLTDKMPGNSASGLGIAVANTYSGHPSANLDIKSWKDFYQGWWRDNPRWFSHPVVCPIPTRPGNGGGNQNPVPEPATMLLFGAGLAGLAGFSRRRMKKS